MKKHTLTISVAQIPIKFLFNQNRIFSQIKKAYRRFITYAPARLRIEVDVTRPENLRESFGPGLRSPGLFVSSEESAFKGYVNLRNKKGKMHLSNKKSEFLFFNFIRGLYSYLIFKNGGILLHASVIAKKNKACIFFGPSGSGKTTLTKLSKNYNVLGDDVAIIYNKNGGFYTSITPWPIPSLRGKPFKSFKIAALFKLTKDKDVYLERLSPPRALAEAFTFIVGIEKNPEIYNQLLTRYTRLIKHVPCYRLHFRKDNSFWKEIDRVVK